MKSYAKLEETLALKRFVRKGAGIYGKRVPRGLKQLTSPELPQEFKYNFAGIGKGLSSKRRKSLFKRSGRR